MARTFPLQQRRTVGEPAALRAQSAATLPEAPQRRRGGLPTRLAWVVATLDVAALTVAAMLAWPLRGLVPFGPAPTHDGVIHALSLSPLLVALWVGLLAVNGAYDRRDFGSGTAEFHRVAKASAVAPCAAATLLHFSDVHLSRGFSVSTFVLGGCLLLVERRVLRSWIQRNRLAGAMTQRVLAVGSQAAVRDLAESLGRERSLGYDLIACLLTDGSDGDGVPVVTAGSVLDIRDTCRALDIDTVMVTGSTDLALRQVAWDLEGQDVELIVVPGLADVSAPRLTMRPRGGLPLLHVEEPQVHRAGGWPKKAFDVAGAAAVLLVAAPLMLVVAACVKLGDGGPVFYRQARVGRNGAIFGVWKFRSMAVDADLVEAELRDEAGHEGALFKLTHDPRITPIGRFIRRYSIDELPQLVNVLAGEMSLVGPRPQQQWEVDTYTHIAQRRLHVRPGMTGLWQVSGRSRLTWDEALRLDLYYRDNWSMLVDLAIIGRTVKAVMGKDGAY